MRLDMHLNVKIARPAGRRRFSGAGNFYHFIVIYARRNFYRRFGVGFYDSQAAAFSTRLFRHFATALTLAAFTQTGKNADKRTFGFFDRSRALTNAAFYFFCSSRRALAAAFTALVYFIQKHFSLRAENRFFKIKLHINGNIATALLALSTAKTAEKIAENFSKIKINFRAAEIAESPRLALAGSLIAENLAVTVVFSPLFLIAQHLISFIRFFKLFFISPSLIRMVFMRQTAITFFYFLLAGVLRNAENLVIILAHI